MTQPSPAAHRSRHETLLAVTALATDYAWAMDDRDPEAVLALFREDATFTVVSGDGSVLGPRRGHAEMRAHFAETIGRQLDVRRHVISNVRVIEDRDGEVSAEGYLTLQVTVDGQLGTRCTGRYRWSVDTCGPVPRFRDLLITLDGRF